MAADENGTSSPTPAAVPAAVEREITALVHDLLPGRADAAGEQEIAGRILQRVADFISLAHGAFADSTLAALRSDGRLFSTWCRDRGLSWLPADPETVVAFVLDQGRVRKPSTVARYLASI